MTYQSDEHAPVMLQEAVTYWRQDPKGYYVDATFGRGGHSRALLQSLAPEARLLAFDRDRTAIAYGEEQLLDPRLRFHHGNYDQIADVCADIHWSGQVSGILVDCGLSSPQLDEAERGFSFQREAKLDMRMDQSQALTAAAWLAGINEQALADTLYRYGDERFSRRIAKVICQRRRQKPIETTKELADLVMEVVPRVSRHTHPATRTFQAIRVAVNDEFGSLERFLSRAFEVLKVGGRLVMISFHSSEHRLIKDFIQRHRPGNQHLKSGLQTQTVPRLQRLGRLFLPSFLEKRKNSRSRSAQMRIVEKLL